MQKRIQISFNFEFRCSIMHNFPSSSAFHHFRSCEKKGQKTTSVSTVSQNLWDTAQASHSVNQDTKGGSIKRLALLTGELFTEVYCIHIIGKSGAIGWVTVYVTVEYAAYPVKKWGKSEWKISSDSFQDVKRKMKKGGITNIFLNNTQKMQIFQQKSRLLFIQKETKE